MPDFNRFRGKNSGDANVNGVANNGFNDGFNDSFNDSFDDNLNNGFNDSFDDGFNDSFDDNLNDGFNDGFNDDVNRNINENTENTDEASPMSKKTERENADLKAGFAALFKAISDRFTGKSKPTRETSVDGLDTLFANEFDDAVDDGFSTPPDEMLTSDSDNVEEYSGEAQINEEQANGETHTSFEEPTFDRSESFGDFGGNTMDNPSEWNDSGDITNIFDFDDNYGNDDFAADGDAETPDIDGNPEECGDDESAPPDEGSMQGVFAAIADGFAKFRRRLPSFRPKVYVPPEPPEYRPEQDGIGNLTLASDIKKILEEQNKPGETELEYNRMRSYISSVSTDTRIRPGDIKAPENIGEVHAAESELYNLIDEIISANERQRSRIGVYEKPQEEDPYNYRGINTDRQIQEDMEAYSFDMNPRYGFESQEKIDPDRKAAEMEFNRRISNQAATEFPDGTVQDIDSQASDGFDDDFDDEPDNPTDSRKNNYSQAEKSEAIGKYYSDKSENTPRNREFTRHETHAEQSERGAVRVKPVKFRSRQQKAD